MLALQMQADRFDVLVGERFQCDGAIGSTAFPVRVAKALVGGVGVHESVVMTKCVRAMARPKRGRVHFLTIDK
ncbi:hypothetical protein ISP17_14935 [Dyella ginsengisoli]|uniref:Uncharacterized protein n=1 Tax=Dyella ginsengisoli TaxID=363848 RepID=A0ABW8JZR2_9GAMM